MDSKTKEMKLISVIIAWCSCKGPGRSHLLLMAYAACAFAGVPIKQTGLQKLVRCTPVPLLPTPLSKAPLFLPLDILHTSCYGHQRASISSITSLCLSASPVLSPALPISVPKETQTKEVLPLVQECWCKVDQTENGSSRFCSGTNLAHHLWQIS